MSGIYNCYRDLEERAHEWMERNKGSKEQARSSGGWGVANREGEIM